ncbi:MAG: hypothetical protein ACJ761_02725 [Chloroflexota bacterium]
MFHPDQATSAPLPSPLDTEPVEHRACLVAGCPCKDPRIVSFRRAAFFRSIAQRNGETANRHIPSEAGWSFLQTPALA